MNAAEYREQVLAEATENFGKAEREARAELEKSSADETKVNCQVGSQRFVLTFRRPAEEDDCSMRLREIYMLENPFSGVVAGRAEVARTTLALLGDVAKRHYSDGKIDEYRGYGTGTDPKKSDRYEFGNGESGFVLFPAEEHGVWTESEIRGLFTEIAFKGPQIPGSDLASGILATLARGTKFTPAELLVKGWLGYAFSNTTYIPLGYAED